MPQRHLFLPLLIVSSFAACTGIDDMAGPNDERADELGAVFGRDRAVYVTVAQGALAQNLLKELRRLEGFNAARLES